MNRPVPHGSEPAGGPVSARRLLLIGLALLLLPALTTVATMGRLPDFDVFGYEWLVLAVLAVLRIVCTLLTKRRLIPILDLPLLGVVFVFTGGEAASLDRSVFTESPLDPALFLIYALLAFYLERAPRERAAFRYYGAFLLGFLGMYGLVLMHVHLAQQELLSHEAEQLESEGSEIPALIDQYAYHRATSDAGFDLLRERIDKDRAANPITAASPYFGPDQKSSETFEGGASIDESYELLASALERQEEALRSAARFADPETTEEQADEQRGLLIERFSETEKIINAVAERMVAAASELIKLEGAKGVGSAGQERWYENLRVRQPFLTMETISETQRNIQGGLFEFFDGIRDLATLKRSFASVRQRMMSERLAIAILVLATLYLLSALRMNFEREVEQREQGRAAVEVRAKELEKDNWIALTAGLTHSIGNDILAYDAYGEEALDALEGYDGEVPEEVRRNLRFIHDSNKARMGFIKFLNEFAQARKDSAGGMRTRPVGLVPIDLEPFLREVRRQVGVIEVADLQSDSREPQVQEQRRKFLELPLEVIPIDQGESGARLSRGKPGILRFFFYELIKNSLRNCSGDVPIKVEIERRGRRMVLRFVNDLSVQSIPPDDASGTTLYRLPRIANMEACSEEQLRLEVEDILEQCFEPSRGGGTGLGLFLIRYFAREYYAGSISASVHDWERRLVAFELDLPDDLDDLSEEPAGE